MKNSKYLGVMSVCLVVACLFCGCEGGTASTTLKEYNQTFERVKQLEQLMTTIDFSTISGKEMRHVVEVAKDLYYDYNPIDLKPEQVAACEALKGRVDALREDILAKTNSEIGNFAIYPYSETDCLMETSEVFPVYLLKGETLKIDVTAAKPITVKISNANSRTLLKTISQKTSLQEVYEIKNTAIYLVEINPNGTQYVDYKIYYNVTTIERLCDATPVDSKQVECNKGDFGAKGVPGVEMQRCFEEPRKFTLRGQIKSTFSGSSKALVAVPIPTGATDILYSMRIDTSEKNRSEDGQFHDNLSRSYTRMKFLGLPLYERSSSNGLLNTLLDDNRPIRDEDAYCNMYVFRNQSQAKQFQDGTKQASKLSYDVDYSTLGTQSCNGRIPTKGAKTIYLAFENERMRYSNYLWVEVEAVVPKTVYYTTRYSVE